MSPRERSMSRTKKSCITWGSVLALLGLLLAALALTGCVEMPAIAAVEPTASLYPPPTDVPPPPQKPTPEALEFPLPASVTLEKKEPIDDQTCVDCHTDEETLRAVATEEEEGETLSEGEG
jgi:hypothetical protein